MDPKGLIMYFGTFSKILSPGMRLGWIAASPEIIGKVNLIAQAAVLQTATINAMVISKYLDMFDIDAHVAKILPVYKHRCELMINTMRAASLPTRTAASSPGASCPSMSTPAISPRSRLRKRSPSFRATASIPPVLSRTACA